MLIDCIETQCNVLLNCLTSSVFLPVNFEHSIQYFFPEEKKNCISPKDYSDNFKKNNNNKEKVLAHVC